MKKYLFTVPLAFLFCVSFSCQDKAAMAELEKYRAQAKVEELNVVLVRQFLKAIDAQDYKRFNELLAPGAILHGTAPQEAVTAENSGQLLKPVYQALPDIVHSVEDIFAWGDRVVARAPIQATHKGEFMGVPPYREKTRILSVRYISDCPWQD